MTNLGFIDGHLYLVPPHFALRHSHFALRCGGLRKAREREKDMLQAESRRLRMKELQLAAKEGKRPRDASTLSWNNDSDSLMDLLSSMWQSLKD